MNDPILIGLLVFGIGSLTGYLFGIFKSDSLEKMLIKEISSGKEVCVLVNKKGMMYRLEDGKLKSSSIGVEEKENGSD
ncbi:MAG: hypothetical protein DRI84_07950 [Bacteroidetes bacterium]|nr:MAG: hypothetical protein DRI84_07950 [Bacteroidota bacterium]